MTTTSERQAAQGATTTHLCSTIATRPTRVVVLLVLLLALLRASSTLGCHFSEERSEDEEGATTLSTSTTSGTASRTRTRLRHGSMEQHHSPLHTPPSAPLPPPPQDAEPPRSEDGFNDRMRGYDYPEKYDDEEDEGGEVQDEDDYDDDDGKDDAEESFRTYHHAGETYNTISLAVFVAQRAGDQSQGMLMSDLVIRFLDDLLDNIDFMEMKRRERPPRFPKGDDRRHSRRIQSTRTTPRHLQDDQPLSLFLRRVDSNVTSSFEDSVWWWEYGLIFACYSKNNESVPILPINDRKTLNDLETHLRNTLDQQLVSCDFQCWIVAQGGFRPLDITVDKSQLLASPDPQPSTCNLSCSDVIFSPDDDDMAFTKPAPSPPHDNIADSSILPPILAWDWRRNLALGVLLGTLLTTAVLMQVAAHRHRQLHEQQFWANLATEKGVDELLNTTWKIQGSQMAIYQKNPKHRGYRDADSILMGGFEHHGGGELTITHRETDSFQESEASSKVP